MTLRERIVFGAAPKRLPFDLRDLRAALLEAQQVRPNSFLFGLVKQVTRVMWPTEKQLSCANAIFRELSMPESTCMTRDKVMPRKDLEPTKAEVLARDCAALDAVCAARPLKPPARRASYEPVSSEVHKLRVQNAHPDHDGFHEAFVRERL